MLALQACRAESFKSDDVIINEVGEDCALYDRYIDQYGNEGIVAFVGGEDFWEDCIIVVSLDEGYESWGPLDETVYKVDEISFDTITNYYILYYPVFGLMMQQSMKSMGIERFPAQQWCDRKNQGDPYPNAASWRLPSYYEAQLIFSSPELNDALIKAGGTPIDNNHFYWTCAEDIEGYVNPVGVTPDYDQENRAILLTPLNTSFSDKDHWLKTNKHHVRAIKYVYYKN